MAQAPLVRGAWALFVAVGGRLVATPSRIDDQRRRVGQMSQTHDRERVVRAQQTITPARGWITRLQIESSDYR